MGKGSTVISVGSISPSNDQEKDDGPPVIVCGISLARFGRNVQFVLCSSAILFFFVLYGYLQEFIFAYGDFKPFGWHLTLMQFLYYSLFGFVELQFKQNSERRIPIRIYCFLAFLTVTTMGCSNTSLGFLNYPTQVIFKCCKLIPVMFGGMVIQKKVYNRFDFMSVTLMTFGLIFFTIADQKASPNFNMVGVALISAALMADAVIGNVQEKMMREYKASNCEMVLYSYSIGFVYILIGEMVTGTFTPAFTYFNEHPKVYLLSFLFSFVGYLGILFVLSMVKTYGALLAVTVTTFRKALSIIMSFIFFTKPFTLQYVWSGLLVLLGISLNIFNKNRNKLAESGKMGACKYFLVIQLAVIFVLIIITSSS